MPFAIFQILLLLMLLGKAGNCIAMEIKDDSLEIPTAEIILIWERYCMQHMTRGEWHLARLNQKAIEFQKDKLRYETDSNQFSYFHKMLEEARAAKKLSASSWGCNPPKAKLANQVKQKIQKVLFPLQIIL